MSLAIAELPTEPDALRAFAQALQAELAAAREAIRRAALEVERLKAQLARLRRLAFGRSSERLTAAVEQLELRLEDLEAGVAAGESAIAAATASAPGPDPGNGAAVAAAASGVLAAPSATPAERCRPKRLPLPEHLSREEVIHDPPGGTTCPACGGAMRALGEDATEVLEYVPGRFHVVRHRRPKLACCRCDAIAQAPAPALPIPRGRAGPALLAHVVVAKYADHLPLHRQAGIYAREGVPLDRSTLADWVGQVAWLLAPLAERVRAHVFAGQAIHADDTPVPVLAPGAGRIKQGRLWVYVRDERGWQGPAPPAAAYLYSPDRRAEHPRAHLAGFVGHLHADAYAGFGELYDPKRRPAPLIEVACWAHARRKLYNVWQADSRSAAGAGLALIRTLYEAEAAARGRPPDERLRVRQDTRAAVDTFFAWAEATLAQVSAKSVLAEALRYALKRRQALSRFLSDARLEADNNRAENALRGVALGRRNWSFAGSDAGGERAAALYTLIETAKLNNRDPGPYLAGVLARVGQGHTIRRLDELLPWRWTAA